MISSLLIRGGALNEGNYKAGQENEAVDDVEDAGTDVADDHRKAEPTEENIEKRGGKAAEPFAAFDVEGGDVGVSADETKQTGNSGKNGEDDKNWLPDGKNDVGI